MGPDASPNPFLRYRQHLDAHRAAVERGWSDARWEDTVTGLDGRVAAIDGSGFVVTPLVPLDLASGPAWAEVETGGVAGSHKARRLFGLALHLLVAEDGAGRAGSPDRADLAIASCGNAALAAATVARALDRRLRVYVPTTADPSVVARLLDLGAVVHPSARRAGERGDPCVRDLHAALAGGAVPFTVQGTVCPHAFDGARTLGLELSEQLAERDVPATDLFVQVGGGALAVAVMEGLERAGGPVLRLHPVQARSASPFAAAWDRLVAWRRLRPDPPDPLDAAEALAPLMEPWPTEPAASAATGILDDVTHDWLGVASWTVRTGGQPVLADEATLLEAAATAGRQVRPRPDPTGAAGLAGLLVARRCGMLDRSATPVVLLTGVDRTPAAAG